MVATPFTARSDEFIPLKLWTEILQRFALKFCREVSDNMTGQCTQVIPMKHKHVYYLEIVKLWGPGIYICTFYKVF